jgi:hypothetical protein
MAQIKPDAFCSWLQGFCELHGEPPTAAQWDSIKEHLALVFTKVTKPGPGEWKPGNIGVDDNGRPYPPHKLPTYCAGIFDGSAAPDSAKYCASKTHGTNPKDDWIHRDPTDPSKPRTPGVYADLAPGYYNPPGTPEHLLRVC